MIDLGSLTVLEAAELLAERSLSSVELVEATLERAAETDPIVHAYVTVMADSALAAARRADEELARGEARGPLHGIPFAVKDVFFTRDAPTEAGSRVLEDFVPSYDATTVRLLREAGAVLVGKHVTHEFACGQNVPPSRNPWNLTHYPGGSSAGGGVSVQVGSSLVALGTDAGGSVRKPAAVTATVGLKPTFGRVSLHGVIPATFSLDHLGTFTRTVEDCAVVLQALAGYDPADPRTIDVPVPDYREGLEKGVEGLRFGVAGYFFGERLEADVRAVVEQALGELERLGAELVPVEIPSLEHALASGFTILMAEAAPYQRRWLQERADRYVPETRRLIEAAAIVPVAHTAAAQRLRTRLCAEVRDAFREARLDALVTPTLPRTSIPIAEMVIPIDLPKFIPFTIPANLTGQPALSVPCGFTPAGLPAGLQFVGRPFDEALVLRAGRAYEQATDWRSVRPSLAAAAA